MSIATQESIGHRFAAFLGNYREEIRREWMEAVNLDERIPAAEIVAFRQLLDHLPDILEDLNQVLRDTYDGEVKERASENAARHGIRRWIHGYDVPELILELAHLRSVLIRHMVNFQEENDGDGGAARLFVIVTLHRFLDDLIRESVEEFLKEPKALISIRRII